MQDMKLIRDVVVRCSNHVVEEDAADIMRLAQDPLLLHEHLQSLERGDPVLQIAVSDGHLEAHLQELGRGSTVCPAAGGKVLAANSYVLRDSLFEASFKPEVFAASGEDRMLAIDQAACSSERSCDGVAVPPHLIGGILIVFGVLLTIAAVFDLLGPV